MKAWAYTIEEVADFQAVLAAADRESVIPLAVDLMVSRLYAALDAGERDLLRLKAIVLGQDPGPLRPCWLEHVQSHHSGQREDIIMPKAPITPITPEIEEDLEREKRNKQAGDPDHSADQKVPGSEVSTEPDGGAQRQPS